MTEENKKNFDILLSIRERHKYCFDSYQEVVKKARKILMSKNNKVSIYGMFPVDKDWLLYDKYDGKLTSNAKNMDFKYYFDENDKILLTERYSNGKLLNYIYYYYYGDYAEVVSYALWSKSISLVQYVEWKDSKLYKVLELEGYMPSVGLMGYFEYIFEFGVTSVKLIKNSCAVFSENNVSNKSSEVILPLKI